jgi:hypothetical protein
VILKSYESTVDIIECDGSSIIEMVQTHSSIKNESDPQAAFTVFQSGPNDNVYCKLEISHALQDGMSTRKIYQDLVLAYQDVLSAEPAPSFRRYVEWIENQDLAHSVNFWTNYLAESSACHIPRLTSTSLLEVAKGTHQLLSIPPLAVSATAITVLCRAHNITPATLFQSAWVLVLRHFTQQDSVLFGYMTAGRDIDILGIEDIVGPMINMLALSMNVDSEMTSAELLKQTHESWLQTVEHQHGLVAAVGMVEEREGRLPWNSVLSIEYAGAEEGEGYFPTSDGSEGSSPLNFETVYGSRAPEFDVVLGVLLGEKSLEVQLGYWDEVIEEKVMNEALAMYKSVLEEWVGAGNLGARVGELEALK